MVLLSIIVCVLVVLLVIAAFIDRKSRRVRGRAGRVRIPGGELSHRLDLSAAEHLPVNGAGPSMGRHLDGRPPTD
jgi:hypothetical protein